MRTFRLRSIQRFAVCLCAAVLVSVDSAQAETFPLFTAVPHEVPENLRPKLGTLLQQNADRLYTHLLMRTDEAARVCGLTDAEVSKLELAAKGAVQHAIDIWLASIATGYATDLDEAAAQLRNEGGERINIRQLADGRQLIIDQDRNIVRIFQPNRKENDNAVLRFEAKGLEFRGAGVQFQGGVFIAGAVQLGGIAGVRKKAADGPSLRLDTQQVDESGVWRATLDRLLTESERAQLEGIRTRRASFTDKSQLDQMLKFIDDELLLDEFQHQRISELCQEFLADRSSSLSGTVLAQIAMDSFSAENLNDLLSKRQLVRWQEVRQQNRPPFDAYRPNVVRPKVIWEGDVPEPRRGF